MRPLAGQPRVGRAAHAAVALIAAALGACGRSPSPVARLVEGQGQVEREHGAKVAAAPNGQPFVVGDAARTGDAAWARLRLRGGAVVRMGADARVRFLAAGARLEVGDAIAEDAAVTIMTEAGAAIIERGGVLRAITRDGTTRFEVVVGRAVIQRADGEVALEAGGGLVVAVGGAILERIAPRPVAPPPPPIPVTPPPSTEPAKLAAVVAGRGVSQKLGAGPWQPLAAGEVALAPGTVIKLPRGAGLVLARGDVHGDDRAAITGPAEVTIGDGAHGPLATAASGQARLQARAGELALAVPGGVITARAGGAAIVDVGRADSRARVERGEIALDGTASDATATAGETGVLDRAGAASVHDRAPTVIDVVVAAGEHAVIHDPAREVAVRVDYRDACATPDATLELADGKGSFADPRRIGGAGAATFYVHAGTSRFRVRCTDGTTVRPGWLRVAGDTGAAPVVRTPAKNVLEADGRRYAVTYQSRPPDLDIGWSEAPGASTLHVQGPTGPEHTFLATGPHHLTSGSLDDGRYTMWITAGARSSPRTTVTLAFDNAAPTAQITAPPPRAAWADPLAVRGTTVEGWSVAVEGQPAAVDASGRFRADVAVGGKRVIAIRLAHPQHGVHYYLRRRD